MSRLLTTFCTCMGMYGFSRGYRSEQNLHRHKLIVDKVSSSIVNGLLYSVPIYNLYHFSKLLNRLEIEYKNLDPEKFEIEYTEINGVCKSTF
jgi:hypothetical protein